MRSSGSLPALVAADNEAIRQTVTASAVGTRFTVGASEWYSPGRAGDESQRLSSLSAQSCLDTRLARCHPM
jgi:hypothetical protein